MKQTAAQKQAFMGPVQQQPANLMRFMQTGATTKAPGAKKDGENVNDGPKYNWSPQMPDPNKMQWYQSPTIMYPQGPSASAAGNMASSGPTDEIPLQTSPTPPASYLSESQPGSWPSDLLNKKGVMIRPEQLMNVPVSPPPPPKFKETGAVIGYATPSGKAAPAQQAQQTPRFVQAGAVVGYATPSGQTAAPGATAAAPAVAMMQQPAQQQPAQQQQPQQPVVYQQQQPVQYVMQQPQQGGVMQQQQQPVQYVMQQ